MAQEKVRVAGGRKKSKKQLTAEEKAAKQEHAKEVAREAAIGKKKADDLDIMQESEAIAKIVEHKAQEKAIEIVEHKTKAIQKKIKEAHKGRPSSGMREYEKFSCEKLISIFGGWFTLSYLFTVQNDDKEQTTTDFYVASQDVSLMRANERPKVNQVIKKQFGKTVYGFAIIAPCSAFE